MRSKSPIRVKRSRSSSSNRTPMKDQNDVIVENKNNNNLTIDREEETLEESAVKIQITEDNVDPNFDGTIV